MAIISSQMCSDMLPCAALQFTGKNTFFGKTATMLQTVDELGNLQKILLKIMLVLVVISLTLCFIALMYLIFDKDTSKSRRTARLCS